jgi:hypothetical protein
VAPEDRGSKGRKFMRREAAGQGLFEAMIVIACAASLLLGAYGLMVSRHGVGRDPRGNSGGTASSAGPGVLAERPRLAGAGGAGEGV